MKRYSLQEMNISGFTRYDIVDTENNWCVVYSTKKYTDAFYKCETLNGTKFVQRPTWDKFIAENFHKGKRAEIWFWRSLSAWDLANICNYFVSEEEFEKAKKLLDSVQRYVLADASEWERENSSEWYCNSAYHKKREAQLNARRERLQKRLAEYGLRMVNYGLYPSLLDEAGKEKYFLHYFD